MKRLSRAAVVTRPALVGWAPWAIALLTGAVAIGAAPVPEWAWAALRIFLQT